jgi:hypothetical protein
MQHWISKKKEGIIRRYFTYIHTCAHTCIQVYEYSTEDFKRKRWDNMEIFYIDTYVHTRACKCYESCNDENFKIKTHIMHTHTHIMHTHTHIMHTREYTRKSCVLSFLHYTQICTNQKNKFPFFLQGYTAVQVSRHTHHAHTHTLYTLHAHT